MSIVSFQQHALDVRRRLWNPVGARASSETEVISETEKRRRLRAQAAALLEARKAQQDFERAKMAGELLLKALQERAYVMSIARRMAEEDAPPPPIAITIILKAVSQYFGVPREEICSQRRQKPIVRPRQIAMYLCREHTMRSFPEIGRRIGNRDHTTVLHAWRKIKMLVEDGDPDLIVDIKAIKRELGVK